MTMEHPRIKIRPGVLAEKPVIRGTRLSVEFIIGCWPPIGPKLPLSPSMELHMTTSFRATPMHAMF
jgi:hypothetical protein